MGSGCVAVNCPHQFHLVLQALVYPRVLPQSLYDIIEQSESGSEFPVASSLILSGLRVSATGVDVV